MMTISDKIKIGISSCLLGQPVRYDGGRKYDPYINGTLNEYFDFIPICPEVAIGLPVPRPPIHLVRHEDQIRVLGIEDQSTDVTDALHAYGKKMGDELEQLSGYIFKSASPSCGLAQVDVSDEQGHTVDKAAGAFAHSLMKRRPLLPVEDEAHLGDARRRDNFIMRVFVYHRWQQMLAAGLSVARLQGFHADHKYLLMAHSQDDYQRLGQMLAGCDADNVKVISCLYIEELMTALKQPATREQHVNVLQHLLGYLKSQLDSDDKTEMLEVIGQYRDGLVPLIVPITLLKHHFRRHPNEYIERQVYLTPHPQELMLHNLM
jgi:uncharacterized protein YbgA (DUF1722 family)/uncharacterized protein YbbK (DUF523 family)